MNPDLVFGILLILTAVLIAVFIWLNIRWNKADREAAQQRREELARRLTLPARLINRHPNHPGNWNPDGADGGTIHRGSLP